MADEIEIIDPNDPGDIFADEALDFDIVNGTLRIRFGIAKRKGPTSASDFQLVHVGRLILPLVSAQRMAVALNSVLTGAGFSPEGVSAPAGQTVN